MPSPDRRFEHARHDAIRRQTRPARDALAGLLALLMPPSVAMAAGPGNLDPNFGNGGKTVVDFSGSFGFDAGNGVAIQKDGRIVVAGDIFKNNHSFALARFTADGKLDKSFAGGTITLDFGVDSFDAAAAVAIQKDGKIVVAGFSAANNLDGDFALARYDTNGTLDRSFSADGKVTTDLGANDRATALLIQPDGKILVAGGVDTIFDNFPEMFALARYNADGTLDKTFSGDGKLVTDLGNGIDGASALALQADGKIVAAGSSAANVTSIDFAVARFLPNGTFDKGFSGDGKTFVNFGSNNSDQAFGLALQPDGGIVVAGVSVDPRYAFLFALTRLTPDGRLDSRFSKDGRALFSFGDSDKDQAYAVAIQPDERIVAVGVSGYDLAVLRVLPDGTLDKSFSGDGKLTTDFDGGADAARAVAIQRDGKIVAAGTAFTSTFTNVSDDFAVVRFRNFFCGGADATLVGSNANERITGTSGRDVILGLGGKDTINGLGGNDLLCGGDGDDTLDGGEGDDLCDGQQGSDTAAPGCEKRAGIP